MGTHKTLLERLEKVEDGIDAGRPEGPVLLQPDGVDVPGGRTPNFWIMAVAGQLGWAAQFGKLPDYLTAVTRAREAIARMRAAGLWCLAGACEQLVADPHRGMWLYSMAILLAAALGLLPKRRKEFVADHGLATDCFQLWRAVLELDALLATPAGDLVHCATRVEWEGKDPAPPATIPGAMLLRAELGLPEPFSRRISSLFMQRFYACDRMAAKLRAEGVMLGGDRALPRHIEGTVTSSAGFPLRLPVRIIASQRGMISSFLVESRDKAPRKDLASAVVVAYDKKGRAGRFEVERDWQPNQRFAELMLEVGL